MSAIAIIPARGNSRRIPRKNIKLFHGKPIIAYSIETAKMSGLFSEVWVSTEDKDIGRIAEGYGARWYKRSTELSEDQVGTQDVARDFIQWMHDQGDPYKYVCCIYPTAPLMTSEDIRCGYYELSSSRYAHYAFSVGSEPLRDAGQFYWSFVPALLRGDPLISTWSRMIPIPESRVCDINTIEDFHRAESMYAALQEKK